MSPPPPVQCKTRWAREVSSHLCGISSCRTSCQGRLLQFASIEVPIGRRESNLSALGSLRELLSSCRTRLIYTVLSARDALTAFLRKNHRLIFIEGNICRPTKLGCWHAFVILGAYYSPSSGGSSRSKGFCPSSQDSRRRGSPPGPRTRTAAVRMRKQGRR